MTIASTDRSDNERDKFEQVGTGKTGMLKLDSGLTQCIAYTTDNQPEYIGEAVPGTAKGSLLWRIKKLTYTGNYATDVQWASGDANFDKEWDERAGYAYS